MRSAIRKILFQKPISFFCTFCHHFHRCSRAIFNVSNRPALAWSRSILWAPAAVMHARNYKMMPVSLDFRSGTTKPTMKRTLNTSCGNRKKDEESLPDSSYAPSGSSELDELMASDEALESKRTILFPENKDPLLQKIVNTSTPSDLLSIIFANSQTISPIVASQGIVTLWDQEKEYSMCHPYMEYPHSYTLRHDPRINVLVNKVQEAVEELSDQALMFTLFAMHRLRLVPPTEDTFQKILVECVRRSPSFTLDLLSRYTIVLQELNNYIAFQAHVVQQLSVILRLKKPETNEELKHLTICMSHMLSFITESLFDLFLENLKHLLTATTKPELDQRTLLKCLNMIVHSSYQHLCLDVVQHLFYVIAPLVPRMTSLELATLSTIITKAECNPDPLKAIMKKAAHHLMLYTNQSLSEQLSAAFCLAVLLDPKSIPLIQSIFLQTTPFLTSRKIRQRLMMIQQHLPFTKDMHDTLWTTVAENLGDVGPCSIVCRSYLHMRLRTKMYRNEIFEKQFTKQILENWDTELFVAPKTVALYGAFLLACNSPKHLPISLRKNIVEMLPQFSIEDLQTFALGLTIARRNLKSQDLALLNELHYKTSTLLIPQLQSVAGLHHLNQIVQTKHLLVSKRMHHGIDTLEEHVLDRYPKFLSTSELTPKLVYESAEIMSKYQYWLPHAKDVITRYVIQNEDMVPAECFVSLLYAFYVVGYCPQHEDILQICSRNILRNMDILSCLQVLRAGLSLGLFQSLDNEFAIRTFSVSFMDKLDHEISAKSSLGYISQVRHLMMDLNRMVCLDYPEFQIPWFHESYCQEQYSKVFHRQSNLEKEVHDILCEILSDPQYFQCHVYTPYYYHLSYECILDSSGHPIPIMDRRNGTSQRANMQHSNHPRQLPSSYQRIAINILPEKTFCRNFPKLHGSQVTKQRHLQILGYKTVEIPLFEWNSLRLADRQSKIGYLYRRIFKTSL